MNVNRWKILSVTLFVILLISLSACGGPGEGEKAPGSSGRALTFEDAAQMVLDQVVKPDQLDHEVIVFGWPTALTVEDELIVFAAADLTTPGEAIPIEADSWFFWVDDAPIALYVHPTRFVLVDVQSGEMSTFNEEWWPVLNGKGLWVEAAEYWDETNWIFSNMEENITSMLPASLSYKLAKPKQMPLIQHEGGPNFAIVVNGWSEGEAAQDDLAKSKENMNDALNRSGFGITQLGPGDSDIPGKIKDWIRDRANEMQTSQTAMIYLTGHGGNSDGLGTIRLGGTLFNEIQLTSALESFHPGVHVIVVIDTCHAGAWSDGLMEVADVNITSTGADQVAYGDRDNADDPNPEDSGTEYTSGYVEDWDEIINSNQASEIARENAADHGTNYWEEVAMMSHISAAAKDSSTLQGLTNPTAVRGNPLTTRYIPFSPFSSYVNASQEFVMQLVGLLEMDGIGDGTLSSEEWDINADVNSVGINWMTAFIMAFSQEARDLWYGHSYFDCGTQVGDVITFCAPEAGLMPDGDVLMGLVVLDADIPLDPGDTIYQYGFVLDSDNDPANNFHYNPPFTLDYFQGTDLWYVVYNANGQWNLGVSTSQGSMISSNARAVIIKNILVYFVPVDEITAEYPSYRFSAFGCVGGGWGSGFCNGDVSGIDASYSPVQVPQEKVNIEE